MIILSLIFILTISGAAYSENPELQDAIDNDNLNVNSDGDARWLYQNEYTVDGDDAAQSGDIGNDQYSSMSTSVIGPGTLTFYWKVSSEENDYLALKDNGYTLNTISGDYDWEYQSYYLDSGMHYLEWVYYKDASHSSLLDCGWVDMVTWDPISTISLPEAVDNSALSWTTSGHANWYGQNLNCYDGIDAAQSGYITSNQYTSLYTTVTGPGTITFQWKVSSESGYDYLRFYDNGTQINNISGEVNWEYQTYTLSSGIHNLEWRYTKDPSINAGSDCGCIDQVTWTPAPITWADALDNYQLTFFDWYFYHWYGQSMFTHDGVDAIQSGDVDDNLLSEIGTSVDGPGILTFWWAVSSDYQDQLRFLDNGSVIYSISGEQDWTFVSFKLNSGHHKLEWIYKKDASGSSGSDCGWIDQVTWTPYTTVPLAEALDIGLFWDNEGYPGTTWFGQINNSHDGLDSARSGFIIDDNQESVLRTYVTGPGILSFWWKVSSDPGDMYYLYDGAENLAMIRGEINWNKRYINLGPGIHNLYWIYRKDSSVSAGEDCAWLDQVTWTPYSSISLPDSLDNTDLDWYTGMYAWFGQNANSYDSVDAARSGPITGLSWSYIYTTVNGPGTISFWWKVSTVSGNSISFYDNNSPKYHIIGETDWEFRSFTIETGSHILLWQYEKYVEGDTGQDCGWLDQVTWTPAQTGNVLLVRTGAYFETIQEAVDQAVNGDTLNVYDGVFYENVLVNKDLTIEAVGDVTVYAADPNQPVFIINTAGGGSTIEDFIISGGSNAFGVYLNSASNCLIIGNTISNNFIGVYIQNSNTNTISGNTILSNGWLGIGVDNSTGNIINGGNNISGNVEGVYLVNNSNGNTISGNNIHNNYDAGVILLNGSNGNNISGNNAISNNGLIGVLIRNSDANTISGNTIQVNGWAGVALDSSDDNSINGGNFITGNQEGLNLTNSSTGNIISGNTITGNTNIGISFINNSSDNEILNNLAISNNGIIGVYLRDSGTNTISGNIIQINNWVGICLDNAPGNTINSDNNISGNLEGLYIVNNSNNNSIQGNNIHDNQDTGMYIDGSTGNQITSNTAISNNGVVGVLFRNADGNTISGNEIEDNNFAGIALDSADSNLINDENSISGSQMGIYVVNGSDGNTITDNTLQYNTWAGLVLDGANNTIIYQNNFIDNPLQALAQNGLGNAFYQGITGNYWNEWTSQNPRPIYGSENLIDQYPNITPF